MQYIDVRFFDFFVREDCERLGGGTVLSIERGIFCRLKEYSFVRCANFRIFAFE